MTTHVSNQSMLNNLIQLRAIREAGRPSVAAPCYTAHGPEFRRSRPSVLIIPGGGDHELWGEDQQLLTTHGILAPLKNCVDLLIL